MTNDQDSFARMEATVSKYQMDIMGITAAGDWGSGTAFWEVQVREYEKVQLKVIHC